MEVRRLQDKVEIAVNNAVARLNEMRDADSQLGTDPNTVLTGSEGQLDSMGLINLLLFVEEELAGALGTPVDVMTTVGEQAASSASFTIGELTALIERRANELS
ncbi:MAG: hypothetical protein HKN56_09250 [Gammaproteobacteria bacterium]|nr:hypothetical protein [Gammaproteobacteria bacterium]NND55137.1 hypothetical protein [Gammaproteobacteria bacterium]